MREFFSMEGTFNKYGGFVADTFILSIMWIFFSIPIITIGASTTALFYVSTRRIANREGYISSDFWQSFKANFVRATLIWLALLAVIALVGVNLLLGLFNRELMEGMGFLGLLVFPVQMVVLMELFFITAYIFPVTARFDMSAKQAVKTSFVMANRHFVTSFACLIAWLALVAFSWVWTPLAFLAPGLYAMASSVLIMRIFKKYRPEMDKDPILELQEFEQKRAEEKRRAALGLPPLEEAGETEEPEGETDEPS